MKPLLDRVTGLLGSRKFYYGVLALFVFQALWIAFSAIYPLPFDEDFHVGIIRIYAEQWSPFLGQHPAGADAFGAIARDPSYFYHYLMSFPYRFVGLFTENATSQIIVLRVLNVAMLAGGLELFRRLLLKVRLSPALTHTSLLIFVLIPIVPQLGAHINYDNVLIPLVAAICLLALRVMAALRQGRVDMQALMLGAAACLFTSIVKYAFLPMLLGIGIWLGVTVWQHYHGQWRKLWPAVVTGWKAMRRPMQITLLAACIVLFGLCIERYGVNTLRYGTPVPSCDAVITKEQCSAYGPWYRNYLLAQDKDDTAFTHNPVAYGGMWVYWLWYRLFFAINTPSSGYVNYPPLVFPARAAAVLALAGLVAIIVYVRRLWRDQQLMFLLFVSLIYIFVLWAEGYSQYLETGQPVAINGRYLLPILLLLGAVMGRAFSWALAKRPQAKPIFAGIVLLCFLQGGGLLTFLMRSDASWDWPNQTVIRVNNAARTILSPFVIEGSKTYKTTRWF